LVQPHRTINSHLTLDGFQYALATTFVVFPGNNRTVIKRYYYST
jgi:hypothetical protein